MTHTQALIGTDVLESALSGIVVHLQQQDNELASFRAQLSDCVTRSEVAAVQHALGVRLEHIERRIEALERDTAVFVDNAGVPVDTCVDKATPSPTSFVYIVSFYRRTLSSSSTAGTHRRTAAGSLLVSLSSSLAQLQATAQQLATSAEVAQVQRNLESGLAAAAAKAAEQGTPREMAIHLQKSQEALQNEVVALQVRGWPLLVRYPTHMHRLRLRRA
jgi:hypothetical protein